MIRKMGGSPRFFDVAMRGQRVKAAGGAMLFETAPLNRTILIKHTLREREREEQITEQRTATKIIFPIDADDLSVGGFALFIEEKGFERHLAEYLGDARGAQGLPRDIQRLGLLADASMFDPYLVRERFRMNGLAADDAWFELDPKREQEVLNHIFDHIRQMFYGATGDDALARKFADGFCYKVFSNDFVEYAERLNAFFGLDSEHMLEALFAWKALLYQRLVFSELQDRLAGELKLVLEAPLPFNTSKAEGEFMRAVQQRLRDTVRTRYGAARLALANYNTAYNDFSVRKRPAAFIRFLRVSSELTYEVGENIALLLHYGGLLTFRIKHERALRSVNTAMELHQDLATALDGDEECLARPDLAAV